MSSLSIKEREKEEEKEEEEEIVVRVGVEEDEKKKETKDEKRECLRLAFQRELFADFVPESGLVVMARGLGTFQMTRSFIELYANPKLLVFLLGANAYEEETLLEHFTGGEEQLIGHVPFKVIKNDTSSKQRQEIYLHGGVISITSRIMLIDILKERMPVHLTTGLILLGAERITEFCLETFIIDLYQSKNQAGFIKSFSDKAEALIGGFAKVEKIMKFLKVPKLYLYPRFHATVKSDLDDVCLNVEELKIPMTQKMKIIQLGLLELMETCLSELVRANASLDLEQFNMETAVTGAFDVKLRRQLDPIWHRVSLKSKQIIHELYIIRTLLEYLVAFDAISYCKFLETLLMADSSATSTGGFKSYWLMLETAQSVIQTAKDRVYKVSSKDGTLEKGIETMPKWKIVEKLLKENEGKKVLIMTKEEHTRCQMFGIIKLGYEKWQDTKYENYLKWRKSVRRVSGFDTGVSIAQGGGDNIARKRAKLGRFNGQSRQQQRQNIIERGTEQEMTKKGKEHDGTFPLTKVIEEDVSSFFESEYIEEDLESDQLTNCVVIKCYEEGCDYDQMLGDQRPEVILLFDGDLAFLRAIEVYSHTNDANNPSLSILVYKESIEEQRQLLAIRQEKEAFEELIRIKSNMAPLTFESIPLEPDIGNNTLLTKFTGTVDATPKSIIVDLRELKSSLPFILHRHGFLLEPKTIDIGDYILTPEVCVERKSVSDLISSLNSGRLYTQVEAMIRHYTTPVLLIEFDENKPFTLLPTELRADISVSDISSKLCLLLLHFPKLYIIWSSSLANTADVFRELKRDAQEPISSILDKPKGANEDEADPTAKDLLLSLPGVNTSNCYLIMRHVKSMKELASSTLSTLIDLIGKENATKLYTFLHEPLAFVKS